MILSTGYYLAGSERIAMRVITLWVVDGGSSQLYYLFTDHLGSTSEVRRADGSLHSRQYYRAFGEERYTYGALPTDRTYTGQRKIENGLVHYEARTYDPVLARFVQADTIIPQPGNPMAWDRFAYVLNSPIQYNDPTGHAYCTSKAINAMCMTDRPPSATHLPNISTADKDGDSSIDVVEAEHYLVKNLQIPGNDLTAPTTLFGANCTTSRCSGQHAGIDFGGKKGKGTAVTAAYDGIVVEVDRDCTGDLGCKVVLEHNVAGHKFYSIYAHLSSIEHIYLRVYAGDTLGWMGSTPFEAGDVHLHFEIRKAANINLGNAEIIPMSAESYWIDDSSELRFEWVDVGWRLGYSPNYPANWPKGYQQKRYQNE